MDNKEKEKKRLKERLHFSDKTKKILKVLLGVIILIVIIILVNINNYNEYNRISKVVNDNYKELENIAKEYLKGNQVDEPDYVGEITVYKDNKTVEFYTGGQGLVSNATYYGFYYNSEDKPISYQNEFKLKQIGKKEWMWVDKGDNEGKTFKIRDNWYYFEASF